MTKCAFHGCKEDATEEVEGFHVCKTHLPQWKVDKHWPTHIGHCCARDNCKYGDDDCPVKTRKVDQLHPCEWCHEDGIETVEQMWASMEGKIPTCPHCGHVLRPGDRDVSTEDASDPSPSQPMGKVVKTLGHCYDGCGWVVCSFWGGHGVHSGPNSSGPSRCLLFGGAQKHKSHALVVCDKTYGSTYEGKP